MQAQKVPRSVRKISQALAYRNCIYKMNNVLLRGVRIICLVLNSLLIAGRILVRAPCLPPSLENFYKQKLVVNLYCICFTLEINFNRHSWDMKSANTQNISVLNTTIYRRSVITHTYFVFLLYEYLFSNFIFTFLYTVFILSKKKRKIL